MSFHKSILSSKKALQKEGATIASFKGQEQQPLKKGLFLEKHSFKTKLSTSV